MSLASAQTCAYVVLMATSTTTPTFTTGDRFRKAREYARLTSQEMAVAVGVSRNTIGNYEHDRTEPTLTAIKVYAERTGVPVTWLMGIDEPSEQGVSPTAWNDGATIIALRRPDEQLGAIA